MCNTINVFYFLLTNMFFKYLNTYCVVLYGITTQDCDSIIYLVISCRYSKQAYRIGNLKYFDEQWNFSYHENIKMWISIIRITRYFNAIIPRIAFNIADL